MRLNDPRYHTRDVSDEDIAREKLRSPMARQLCGGSSRQLMQDVSATVECPECLRKLKVEDKTRNRDQWCPIVPSHMADADGVMRRLQREAKRKTGGKRPY